MTRSIAGTLSCKWAKLALLPGIVDSTGPTTMPTLSGLTAHCKKSVLDTTGAGAGISLDRKREKHIHYLDCYNTERVHLGIQLLTPMQMLQRS